MKTASRRPIKGDSESSKGVERFEYLVERFQKLPQIDLVAIPEDEIELKVSADGTVIWVNVGPKCVLRICRIKQLRVEDGRKRSSKVG